MKIFTDIERLLFFKTIIYSYTYIYYSWIKYVCIHNTYKMYMYVLCVYEFKDSLNLFPTHYRYIYISIFLFFFPNCLNWYWKILVILSLSLFLFFPLRPVLFLSSFNIFFISLCSPSSSLLVWFVQKKYFVLRQLRGNLVPISWSII